MRACSCPPLPLGAGTAIDSAVEAAHGPYGIDTSSHTTVQDWQWFSAVGAEFAWVKATEGDYYTSPVFSAQYTGATEQQMVRGGGRTTGPATPSGRPARSPTRGTTSTASTATAPRCRSSPPAADAGGAAGADVP